MLLVDWLWFTEVYSPLWLSGLIVVCLAKWETAGLCYWNRSKLFFAAFQLWKTQLSKGCGGGKEASMVGVTVIPLENKEKMKTDQRCCQAKEFQVGQTKEVVQPTEVGNTKISRFDTSHASVFLTFLSGRWDPLADFHLFQLNVTNLENSASPRVCCAWKITVYLVSLALQSLKDLISVQPSMRWDYGWRSNTKVILGKFVQTNCVFRKGRGWPYGMWGSVKLINDIFGFCSQFKFFPVTLICSFERKFSKGNFLVTSGLLCLLELKETPGLLQNQAAHRWPVLKVTECLN